MHFETFKDPALLREIIETIVVPNIMMRDDDEEVLDDDPTEYIQRDMEVRRLLFL
jgi:exportin-2 (importin alpha re-exporter)